MRKSALLLSAAGIFVVSPAYAQNSTGTPAPEQQETSSAEAAAPNARDYDEIVVTANQRASRISDVPIAVSAVNSETLANSGANDIRQLNQLAPSLLVSSTGSEANGSARIRGVGTVGDNPGLESSVAVFVDGVYRSRSGIGLNELGEIDRVEVLRGPQGTLFGRNASAGLIHVISKKPSFTFGATGEATYGNYDYWRLAAGITGPITETLAARLDGVYVKRDGFYTDVISGNKINDRDRLFVRGQLLFEPSDAMSFRLIGDYTTRTEACCAAVYVSTREIFDPTPATPGGDLQTRPNRIVDILTSLGGVFPSAGDPYNRRVAVSPGRNFNGKTTDWGVSGQLDWDLGGAKLTSITAYRNYKASQGGDLDYGNVDLLARTDDSYREFKTFSQELRLQGSAFDGKLDWLIGGYYANETLELTDDMRFGSQYGAFAACRMIASINPAAAIRNPAAPGCLNALSTGAILGTFTAPIPAALGGGTEGQRIIAGLNALSTVSNVGDINAAYYEQKSENFAAFTHNIINFTDTLSLTLGLRYTHETKKFRADFNNNNAVCAAIRPAMLGGITSPTATATGRTLLGGILTLACQGNSSTELNGLDLRDKMGDNEFTGTAVLSYKPSTNWLFYGSYSKGYKAGGFNLDRSALGGQVAPFPTNASVANLRFDAENVDAYEVGVKFDTRQFKLNVAAFRQEFRSFQLNTFNGSVFLVQNINGCSNLAGGPGADSDASNTTGTCAPGDVTPGLISQGVEAEASIYPARDLAVTLGYTYANTKFKEDLVGRQTGTPLDSALFLLPDQMLSNAPEHVVTASFSYTPELGNSGLSGLFYVDTRMTSDFNTGSDLFPEKAQDGFVLVNARVGLRGPNQNWSVELWAQNLLNTDYQQVAFNAPFQSSAPASTSVAQVNAGFSSFANQIFTSYLAEPRTYGITLRGKF